MSNANSISEKLFEGQIMRYRLPVPVREHRFAKAYGKRHAFDFCWPDYKLAVECDGFKVACIRVGSRMQRVIVSGHGTPGQMASDADKRNMAILLGWSVAVFHENHISSGQAIAITQRLLASRGWTPALLPVLTEKSAYG